MRIDDLKAFMVVADVGSFRTASELLSITQPALSRRIQKLESLLETKLLARTTRRVQLTASGILFLERIRNVVVESESAIVELRRTGSQRQGLIRIACLPSVGMSLLPRVIEEFHRQSARVSFRIFDGNALGVTRMVMNDQVDVGIGMELGSETEIQQHYLFSESIGVVCRHDHAVAKMKQKSLTWEALKAFPFAYNLHESGNRLLVSNQLEVKGIRLNWAHQVQSLVGALVIAESGIALAPAPSHVVEAPVSKALTFRHVGQPGIKRQIQLLERPATIRPNYLQRFLGILQDHAARYDAHSAP